jgi:hypothetical protein
MRDRLFILKAEFVDPAYPGRRFFCWHCALLEGVLASFPHLNDTFGRRADSLASATWGR